MRGIRMTRALRRGAIALLWGFAVQFVLGMTLNLFVTIPAHHPGAGGAEYFATSLASLGWALAFGGGPALFVHAWLALLLSAGCLALFIASLTPAGRGWRWLSGIATLFTLGATFNGMSFLDYNEDFSSMIMAACWLIAVGALVAGLVRRGATAEPRPMLLRR